MSLSSEEKLWRLQKALDVGGPTHTISDLIGLLHAGKARLHENEDGVIITEFHEFPLHKACHLWLIAGRLDACLALEPAVDAWALENNCTIETACGRPGWGKVAAPTGWRKWWPNFVKPLPGSEFGHGR
jgi:hypothetical protein